MRKESPGFGPGDFIISARICHTIIQTKAQAAVLGGVFYVFLRRGRRWEQLLAMLQFIAGAHG
jgi:hypothetical protein